MEKMSRRNRKNEDELKKKRVREGRIGKYLGGKNNTKKRR